MTKTQTLAREGRNNTTIIERDLGRVSRPLPHPATQATEAELLLLEMLRDQVGLVGTLPWKASEIENSDEPIVIIDDDQANFAPGEVISEFGQSKSAAAMSLYLSHLHNVAHRLVAEIRFYRSLGHAK